MCTFLQNTAHFAGNRKAVKNVDEEKILLSGPFFFGEHDQPRYTLSEESIKEEFAGSVVDQKVTVKGTMMYAVGYEGKIISSGTVEVPDGTTDSDLDKVAKEIMEEAVKGVVGKWK